MAYPRHSISSHRVHGRSESDSPKKTLRSFGKFVRMKHRKSLQLFTTWSFPQGGCLRTAATGSSLPTVMSNSRSIIWLVVSTHLKNISQIGNLPQIEVKIKNVWNHHLVTVSSGKLVHHSSRKNQAYTPPKKTNKNWTWIFTLWKRRVPSTFKPPIFGVPAVGFQGSTWH